MDHQQVKNMQSQFDGLARRVPDENIEFWFARDLQEPLGVCPLGELFCRNTASHKLL